MRGNILTYSVAVISDNTHLITHRVIRCSARELCERVFLLLDDLYYNHHSYNVYAASVYVLEYGYYKTFIYAKKRDLSCTRYNGCDVVDDLPF